METLQRTANRGSISTGYDIDNSCKFEDDNDEWLYRTNASGTNRKTWTVSWWFKQTELRSVNGAAAEHWQGGGYGEATRAGIFADDRIWIDIGGGDGNTGTLFRSLSTQKIRDTSAWYHIVIACDSTQSTEADRLKVWLNGVEVTAWDQRQYPTLNYQSALQGTGGVQMKWGSADATYHGYSGYLAECNYVDGVTATQNDFGEFDDDSGIWKPKEYTGSYGTNGSYLDFKIASDLGANAKGNDTNFSLNNITAADQATDTPTNNFATMNPLWNYFNEVARVTISDGGTRLTGNQSGTIWRGIPSTIPVTAGKWYWEVERGYNGNGIMVGYGSTENIGWRTLTTVPGSGSGKMLYSLNGDIYGYDADEDNRTQYAGNFNTIGDIVSIALDVDNGWAYTRYNGAAWHSSGNPSSGSTGTGAISIPWSPEEPTVFVVTIPNNNQDTRVNFGGYTTTANTLSYSDSNNYGAFKYAVPTGYYALCTKNLAEYG